jgi:hypothetical protein
VVYASRSAPLRTAASYTFLDLLLLQLVKSWSEYFAQEFPILHDKTTCIYWHKVPFKLMLST